MAVTVQPASAATSGSSPNLTGNGPLVNLVAEGAERERLLERAVTLPQLRLSRRELSDVHTLAIGGFSPLDGFLMREDYAAVVAGMHLASGEPWPIPITLSAGVDEARRLPEGADVALMDDGGALVGVLHLAEKYPYDKEHEAQLVYRTTDEAHPGVRALYAQGEMLLGGRLSVLDVPRHAEFARFDLRPSETRGMFAAKGWRRVAGFQTRNPVHRAHEYLQKAAMEIVDGLLLHPLVGETKDDDVPAAVRMRCYQVLLERYYPLDRVLLAIYPAAMRYAGPREAVLHALVRRNYGCTHFIVGRDHAGVGNYYGTYDAQHIFDEFAPGELGITPLFFEHAFFCRACGGMASAKTCPHDASHHVTLSGTKVRAMLQAGETPPVEFTRPEVAQVLMDAVRAPALVTAG